MGICLNNNIPTEEYYGGTYPDEPLYKEELDYETRFDMEMEYADIMNEQYRMED